MENQMAIKRNVRIIVLLMIFLILTGAYATNTMHHTTDIVSTSNSGSYEDWLQKAIDICKNNAPFYLKQYWNWQAWLDQSTNCYAYAFDLTKNPLTGDLFKKDVGLQPGQLSGQQISPDLYNGFAKENQALIDIVASDMSTLGYTFLEADPGIAIPAGAYMVTLAVYPGDRTNQSDYHWYRLNPDGTWSHKPGFNPVTNLDDSGNTITDPFTADRGHYFAFVGYFYIAKNL
jgi:hypothetical protein